MPTKLLRNGLLARLSLLNPERGGGKLSEREKFWRSHLKAKKAEQRRRLVALRKEISRARKPILQKLEAEVDRLRQEHSFFKGVLLFGSFAKGKRKPKDIDYMAIFDVSSSEKSQGYKKYERYVVHCLKQVTADAVLYSNFMQIRLLSAEDLARELNKHKEHLESIHSEEERRMKYYAPFTLRSWHFIGDPATKKAIAQALGEEH